MKGRDKTYFNYRTHNYSSIRHKIKKRRVTSKFSNSINANKNKLFLKCSILLNLIFFSEYHNVLLILVREFDMTNSKSYYFKN